jgi:hypothetical protein
MKYNKIEALEYLVKIGPEYIDEWTEAGMYHSLCEIIESNEKIFTKKYLDNLLKQASEY